MMKEFLYVYNNSNINKKIIEMLLALDDRMSSLEAEIKRMNQPKHLNAPPMLPPGGPTPGPLPKPKAPVSLRGTIINELKELFDKRTQYDKRSRD